MHYVYIRPMAERSMDRYDRYEHQHPEWLERRLSDGFYKIELDIHIDIHVAIQW